jgi:DNA-binding MarR family transcriptional regulator
VIGWERFLSTPSAFLWRESWGTGSQRRELVLHNATDETVHPIATLGSVTTKRDDRIQAVYTEMAAITRRALARNRRLSEPLTVVQHTLLTFIASTPECRAIDIAGALRLNRSTVSRQVADLVGLDLIESGGSSLGGRGQILSLTERGEQLLDTSLRANQEALERRLGDWSDAEIDALAQGLERFNAADES